VVGRPLPSSENGGTKRNPRAIHPDDIDLIAADEQSLQKVTTADYEAVKRFGLDINSSKTKCMATANVPENQQIMANGKH
jgi:hypothetical protein